ncbi:hypothetical protein G5V65_21705 [Rhodobacter sp. HX-7-19]|uniref:Uncharacterized protein n=1 Tax=Paragemmobacter kunshanensis TaxID=2583234 RepID=A0A6M1U414_9RHOB|nr:hypothetical protein [Rhodobacter kunshanensis]NGQ93492.1 hypothetical protein [Rhodobacter kunshanensis]
MADVVVTAATRIEVDHHALDESVTRFAGQNGRYYASAFRQIHESSASLPFTFNTKFSLEAISATVQTCFTGIPNDEFDSAVPAGRSPIGR